MSCVNNANDNWTVTKYTVFCIPKVGLPYVPDFPEWISLSQHPKNNSRDTQTFQFSAMFIFFSHDFVLFNLWIPKLKGLKNKELQYTQIWI